MPGILFVVATPIGNLEDVTFRALRTLREADLIAAEDTRRTAKLLAHYDIRRPMVSLREHNESRETPRLISRLQAGDKIALVSDAGTPTVSDPGVRLVRAAREAGIRVTPIPGPSAVMAALSASGFPADQFVFFGFPPARGQARLAWFDEVAAEERAFVFFEAPHRIRRTLDELVNKLGIRPFLVAREVTKIHEELAEWPITALDERGEFTIVVSARDSAEMTADLDAGRLKESIDCLTNSGLFTADASLSIIATALRVPISHIKRALKRERYARTTSGQAGEP